MICRFEFTGRTIIVTRFMTNYNMPSSMEFSSYFQLEGMETWVVQTLVDDWVIYPVHKGMGFYRPLLDGGYYDL